MKGFQGRESIGRPHVRLLLAKAVSAKYISNSNCYRVVLWGCTKSRFGFAGCEKWRFGPRSVKSCWLNRFWFDEALCCGFIFGLRVECEGRPLWNWQVWDLGLANHGDCMEVDPGSCDVYSRATYTPDFRLGKLDFPFRFSAHPLSLFAHWVKLSTPLSIT
jgi:hypothetical protein